jgi:hypothetical protein
MSEYDYPIPADLFALETFEGSPEDYIKELVSTLPTYGKASLREEPDEYVLVLTTGGWSGCEEVVSTVSDTMFSFLFHTAWKRGGWFEYRVSKKLYTSRMFLGTPRMLEGTSTVTTPKGA